MKKKTGLITALYERLSRDDDNSGDSNSIINQKKMLENYAKEQGYENIVHYTDDGWSGATFDRPSWSRLIEQVKNNEVGAVLVKDMSRVGRDYLQVGFYTEVMFREKEVHFLAISNGIDSQKSETGEFAPFLNIMNEWFVRDTSRKIRTVLKARGMSGVPTANTCPYGYKKDPQDNTHWIIDDEAAEVVRRIFRMSVEGNGAYDIARILYEEKIERPSYYLGKQGLGNHASTYDKDNPFGWRGATVNGILSKIEYLGHTANFKTYADSYKDKKRKKNDESEYVVFKNTHEPIVDEETWKLAQKQRKIIHRKNASGEVNLWNGKVFCADCGEKMYYGKEKSSWREDKYYPNGHRRKENARLECSKAVTSRQAHKNECSFHRISEKSLKALVTETLRSTCNFAINNEKKFIEMVNSALNEKSNISNKTVKERLKKNLERVAEIDNIIKKLYEDNTSGRLSDKRFDTMMRDFESEQEQLEQLIEEDTAEIDESFSTEYSAERFLKLASKYTNFEELTAVMINELIEKIVVYEAVGKGVERTQRIDIYLNYIGLFILPKEEIPMTAEEQAAYEKEQERLRKKRECNRRYMARKREEMKKQEKVQTEECA